MCLFGVVIRLDVFLLVCNKCVFGVVIRLDVFL